MSEWREVKLGDVCENISRPFDFAHKDKVIFINTGDVLNGKFLHFNYSDKNTLPGQAKKAISKDDILFSEIRPKNKRFVYVDFDNTSDFVVSTKFMVLKSNKNLILPKFLYLLITSPIYLNIFQTIAESRSGTFPQITFSSISNVKIKLPPLPIQKKIADILSVIDEKIETLQNINSTLEEMAKAIFKSWFVDFDIVKAKASGKSDSEIAKEFGISKDIVKLFPSEFETSEIGKIPKGWEVKELGNYVELLNGYAFKSKNFIKNGVYGIVTIKNVKHSYFEPKCENYINELPDNLKEYQILKNGDILMSLTGNVGRVCIVIGENYLLNQRVAKLNSKIENWNSFGYFLFSQDSVFNKLQNLAKGTAQKNLSPVETVKLKITLPSNINDFSDIFENIFNNLKSNLLQIQTLQELRDTLLPKLINGEIEVDELDIKGIE